MNFARKLEAITEWPNDGAAQAEWRKQCMSGRTFRNCYVGLGALWNVKLFLHREQRVLGQTKCGWHAARFADMALVYFAKYRTRRTRPLVDADLNFTLASAMRDLAEVPQAVAILKEIETHLLAAGMAAPVETVIPVKPDARTRNQLRKDIQLQWAALGQSLARAEVLVGHSVEFASQATFFKPHFAESAIYLRSIDGLLTSVPDPVVPAVIEQETQAAVEAQQKSSEAAQRHHESEQAALEATEDKSDYYGCIPE